MTIKKTLLGLALATTAMVTPVGKGEEKQQGPQTTPMKEVVTEKTSMPSFIPVTKDGQFDKKKAEEQAKMLWGENGDCIQQFSNDIKQGIPEDTAFKKFAKGLSKGDKGKEQEILSLYEAVKKTHQERDGKMKDTYSDRILFCFAFGLIWANFGLLTSKENKVKAGLIGLVGGFLGASVASVSFLDSGNAYSQKAFVDIQKAIYEYYQNPQISSKQNYTITDMKTTKQMIEIAKKKQFSK